MVRAAVKTVGASTTNLLLNSGMHFRQRISSAASNLAAGYTYKLDRWAVRYDAGPNGSSSYIDIFAFDVVPTIDQNVDVPSNGLSKFSMNFTPSTNGGFPADSTAEADFAQRLEASETRQLSGKKISVAFWCKTDTWANVNIRIIRPTVEDTFSAGVGLISTSKVVATNNTWQQIKLEAIDLSSFDCTKGIELRFEFTSATGPGASGKFVRITQVMMNVGDLVSDWTTKGQSIGEELLMCQRYYEKSNDVNSTPGSGSGWYTNSNSNSGVLIPIKFAVTKRIAVTGGTTFRAYSVSGAIDNVRDQSAVNDKAVSYAANGSRGGPTFYSILVPTATTGAYLELHWTADVEL